MQLLSEEDIIGKELKISKLTPFPPSPLCEHLTMVSFLKQTTFVNPSAN